MSAQTAFMPDVLDPVEKRKLLEDNCDSTEQTTYLKTLTQQEKDLKREIVTDNTIKLYDLADKLKAIKDEYKQIMEPLHLQNKLFCNEMKTGQEEVEGILFHFRDYDAKMLYTYDEAGDLVASRRLRPDEKQAKLFIANS